ncbi:MAG: radical SAM protein [Deltaproteobacteria bacterium]|nr:radical SAM protein [Deltaproteobacteria bacterium]MBW2052282.1 radical SAM protein [Deltaproteobacteria bacterium]MBW2140602.1 radical SAM protein [Deltaproteobacteria bacterium]
MNFNHEPDGFHYEGIIIRPPSEAYSILIQVTLGCSHNKCTFCGTYKNKRFAIKPDEIIQQDLAFAKKYCRRQDRVFLMDGDALILPQKKLTWILDQIQKELPWVKRVGLYANRKSISAKSDEELAELKAKGLGIVYYGVESGDDDVLTAIRKGSTNAKLVLEGRRIIEAGIKLSVTVLLGIGGPQRSLEHARATGDLLSRLDPDYVGALTVSVIPGTPLADDMAAGKWSPLEPSKILVELKELINATDLSHGMFLSNHASNYLPLKIQYPRDKAEALKVIDAALAGKVPLRPEWLRAL